MVLYSFLLMVVLILGLPYWLVRMATSGRYRAGLRGRLGMVPPALIERVAAIRVERRGGGGRRPLIWVHAVSVGEVLAAARLIEELRTGEFQRTRPGIVFALSTTTKAGKHLADERLPECAVFYFPLDFAFAMRRYLKALEPEMVVLIESELWPRLITECEKAGVPIAVVNARISDRSFPRYMRLRRLWRPLLAKVALFLAQSEETALRLKAIGAPRVEWTGNLKYDGRAARESVLVTALRTRLPGEGPVVVCGSTLEGEEALILRAWTAVLAASPKAILVLAPRHPERFDEVAAMFRDTGLPLLRASSFNRLRVTVKEGSVFLLDTIGDLASMYGLAEVAFVGGSLVPAGGHNPLEPAQFGVPVVIGPSFENFREIVEAMRAREGIRIVQPQALAETLVELLQERERARSMGARGRAVAAAQTGAAARSAVALAKLLPVKVDARAEARR
jgi:3-deoxy-D-manno-octulosonic-acid transferase